MMTRTSLEWSFALVGLPTRKFRTWSSGEFQITEWPYGFVLVKNCTRLGEYPTLELAQAVAEATEPAAHSPVTVQPNLPAVGDDVVATVHLGSTSHSAGTMNVRAKVKVVHGNGTLRVSYLKRTGKTFTKEVVTECRAWRLPTDQERLRWPK